MTSPIVLPEISSLLDSECQGIGTWELCIPMPNSY